jgi:biofilm PGA synthesis N-glycosyltransferase PgaC
MHRHGYRIRQDNDAVAWTEAPMTMTALARQRLRWTFGNLQAYHKHRSMVLRPRYGWLGLVGMPLTLFSIAVQALFLPLVYVTTALLLIGGNWRSLAVFAALVTGVQIAMTVTALATVRERTWHLLVVPMYRVVYEPLRVYLLYAALLRALTGRAQRWYRPERTATVTVAA